MKIRSRAPLRLGLAGGGTDVSPYCDTYGGAILNATIGHYVYATIEPLAEGKLEFVSCDQKKSARYERSGGAIPMDGNLDLLKHVHLFVEEKFADEKLLSVRLTTRADVPAGSGLGGSSTLVVAMLRAYA